MKPRVFLGVPSYDGWMRIKGSQAISNCLRNDSLEVVTGDRSSSILPHCFNVLWCQAEDLDCSHFAMLHSDMWPIQVGWLSFLHQELTKYNADIVSAAIAIKDKRQMLSMGFHPKGIPYHQDNFEYLSIPQLESLPQTFDAAMLGRSNDYLLVNTGCWICDMRKPWVADWRGFDFECRLERNLEGKRRAHVLGEDWRMSIDVADAGGRVMATKAIKIYHHGAAEYPNYVETQPPAA